MVDETIETPADRAVDHAEPDEAYEPQRKRPAHSRHRDPIGVIWPVLLICALIALLLLPRCVEPAQDAASIGAAKTIEPVVGLAPETGMVSVWVKEGENVALVLSRYGYDQFIDLGQGHAVVEVGVGNEEEALRHLMDDEDVYDAGLVYEQDQPSALANRRDPNKGSE